MVIKNIFKNVEIELLFHDLKFTSILIMQVFI